MKSVEPWMIVALLGAVILLYAMLLPRSKGHLQNDELLDAVGDVLQQFAGEMEQEHRKLHRLIGEMKREHERHIENLTARIEALEKAHRSSHGQFAAKPLQGAAETAAPLAPEPAPVPAAKAASIAKDPAGAAADKPSRPGRSSEQAEGDSTVSSRLSHTIKSRYRELFELYDSGKSIEYIAKKLGRNKGEVQLILGLAKQEEPRHGEA